MNRNESVAEAPRTNAKARYCVAMEAHESNKRRPETPAKVAYDKLSARVKSFRSYIASVDMAYHQAVKTGPTRGQTALQHREYLAKIGPPMNASSKEIDEWKDQLVDSWHMDNPQTQDARTRKLLEKEILDAPDGAEYAAFYIAMILHSQPVGTRSFGSFETTPEVSFFDISMFIDKACENGQASYFVALYTGKRFEEGEPEIYNSGLWENYKTLMNTLEIRLGGFNIGSQALTEAVA